MKETRIVECETTAGFFKLELHQVRTLNPAFPPQVQQYSEIILHYIILSYF
jgi:hypothetical protein